MFTRGSKVANKLSRGKIPAKAFCFTAGTPVLVKGDTLPIERVAVGDLVLSRVAVTGEQALKRVTEIFVNTTTELVHLGVGAETISTTPKHPFWVEGSGWMDAGDVSVGDRVVLAGGERATIVSVTREKLESPLDVYNFEVADFHTYFVSSAGVWVHNRCGWQVGDDITKRTAFGKPSWSTARKRFWKNEAANPKYAQKHKWTADDFKRMSRGKAPRREGRSMELHHKKPRWAGGSNKADNLRPMSRRAHIRYHKWFGYRGR